MVHYNLLPDIEDLVVATEELSELQKEITKILRDQGDLNHLTEEIADVEIVIKKLKDMFNISETRINSWKEFKYSRLNNEK